MIYPPDPDLNELDELTEEHLGFAALSEGLGFNRQTKAPLSGPAAASGAQQAGPALPVLQAPAPVTSLPTKIASSSATTKRLAPAPSLVKDPGVGAYRKTTAFLLDLVLALSPLTASLLTVEWQRLWQMLKVENYFYSLSFLTLYLGVYFLLAESLGGQSPGKMLLGIQIVEDDKYQKPIGFRLALTRLVLFFFTASLAGIGLFWSLWDSKRRTLHDKWTGTIVRSTKTRF